MDAQDLTDLISKTAMLMEQFDRRCNAIEQRMQSLGGELQRTAQQVPSIVRQSADGSLALICGGALAVILLRVVESAFDDRLGRFFIENSVVLAHGHNIVNVILVDFRGLDTLGEISVVLTAGIAALALLRRKEPEVPR